MASSKTWTNKMEIELAFFLWVLFKKRGSSMLFKRVVSVLDIMDYFLNLIQADVDKSGTIDYGEFIAATLHINKLEREEHLAAAFSYFDKDGSGYITVDELQQACKEQNMEDLSLEDIIKEVDQDNVSSTFNMFFNTMKIFKWYN